MLFIYSIELYPISSNELAKDTNIASAKKILRTMVRTRAMVGETLATFEHRKGKICRK